jgi:butyryl-CoA dehydrogenase
VLGWAARVGALGLLLYCGRLVDEQRTAGSPQEAAEAESLLGLLTPIAKSWPSQWCLRANDLAIQIHGGYGYTRDYDLEQHYRDNRLNPIHEGTHGIQAIDLLGRKVTAEGGAGFESLTRRMRTTIGRAVAASPESAAIAGQLQVSLERLIDVTRVIHSSGADPQTRLANATLYLEATGHIVIAWIWLEQFLATHTRTDSLRAGKRHAARYFYRYELPRTGPQLDLLAQLDRTTLDLHTDWF